jgi:hypothetical protein
MSLQRNVQQQIDMRKAEIRRAARLPAERASRLGWLFPLLESNGVPVANGMLARLTEIHEQEGDEISGVWLTSGREFWEFTVIVSRVTGELIEIEDVSNVSGAVSISTQLPGIAKSFGALAIEVLAERIYD